VFEVPLKDPHPFKEGMGIQSLQLGSAISRLREPVIHLDNFFFLSEMIFSAILRRI
jgi:hypothetical protein